ncbi:MAG: hypothetical protein KGJ06_01800 [Pseudomonadota bacterium]|nr:hypothetical protein [Pseudomonadota bacterium]
MQVERLSFKDLGEKASRRGQPFAPAGKAKMEAPPPPPSFSEEQVKAAERDGYKKGFLEGTQEGRKQAESEQAAVERQLAATVEHFARMITPLMEHQRRVLLATREDMPKLALAIARKAGGQALAEQAEAVVVSLAKQACELLIREPKLIITVHENLGAALARQLEQIAGRLPAAQNIVIQRDPNLPLADCRIEWEHGGMERRADLLWQELEKATASLTAGAARDVQEIVDTPQAPPAIEPETPSQKE